MKLFSWQSRKTCNNVSVQCKCFSSGRFCENKPFNCMNKKRGILCWSSATSFTYYSMHAHIFVWTLSYKKYLLTDWLYNEVVDTAFVQSRFVAFMKHVYDVHRRSLMEKNGKGEKKNEDFSGDHGINFSRYERNIDCESGGDVLSQLIGKYYLHLKLSSY